MNTHSKIPLVVIIILIVPIVALATLLVYYFISSQTLNTSMLTRDSSQGTKPDSVSTPPPKPISPFNNERFYNDILGRQTSLGLSYPFSDSSGNKLITITGVLTNLISNSTGNNLELETEINGRKKLFRIDFSDADYIVFEKTQKIVEKDENQVLKYTKVVSNLKTSQILEKYKDFKSKVIQVDIMLEISTTVDDTTCKGLCRLRRVQLTKYYKNNQTLLNQDQLAKINDSIPIGVPTSISVSN